MNEPGEGAAPGTVPAGPDSGPLRGRLPLGPRHPPGGRDGAGVPPSLPRKSPASRQSLLEGLLGGQRWLPSKAWAGLASKDCVVVTRGGRRLAGGSVRRCAGPGGTDRRAGPGVAGCLLPPRAAGLFHLDHTICLGLGCHLINLYVTEVRVPCGQEAPVSPPTGRPPGLHLCHPPLFDPFSDNCLV